MSTDYNSMDARELAAFACGYLEALDDRADELNRLRDQVAEVTQQLMVAKEDADGLYRRVFSACTNKQVAAQALRDLDILNARAQMQ